MKTISFAMLSLLLNVFLSCGGQSSQNPSESSSPAPVGGPFENSEYYQEGMPANITAVDSSAAWKKGGAKLHISGVIFKADGTTPAKDVVLYYYQTDTNGRYVHNANEPRSMQPDEQGRTHGYIRGWVKTGADGRYSIYTIRPGFYPRSDEPAHIHATIIEPGINEYYIDDFLFDDDKYLTTAKRKNLQKRGGSGILVLEKTEEIFTAKRNIILGMNIPNYNKGR